ncbi:MAG: hypothetical protein ACE5OP_01890 [Candidatus Glassbacteria bacterium]
MAFLVIAVSVEGAAAALAFHKSYNLWLFNIFIVVDYSFLALVFSFWQKKKTFEKILRLSVPLFLLFWLGAKLFQLESFDQINNYSRTLESLILTAISLYTLYILNEEDDILLIRDRRFWAAAAVLIYFAGNMMIFAIGEVILGGVHVWLVHSSLNIVTNLCYAGAFLCLALH